MATPNQKLEEVRQRLEELYGPLKAAGPSDPYEMIVYLNCGYPATDTKCAKVFDALKREAGVSPKELLAVPKAKLAKLARPGGMMPELRAERLKEIARRVKDKFGGDLTAVLKKWMLAEKKEPGKGIRGAKKVLQEFPVIGEPSAEKILLSAKLAPIAAVPSAHLHVPIRIFFGEEGKNYAADYRKAREILSAGLPETFEARQRMYLLLKKHGQEVCKRFTPKCEICPLTAQCAYLQAKAADSNTP